MQHLADDTRQALSRAARNLLCDCGGFAPGDELLIYREDARHGWYDAAVADAVAQEAARMGIAVRLTDAPPPAATPDPAVAGVLASPANIVYFARIGDQDRFGAAGAAGRRVMVYARNAADLASPFGQVPHQAMRAFKAAVDGVLIRAQQIEITCPAGTRITGSVAQKTATPQDTTIRRFPLGVPAPVSATDFSGRVALVGGLTPTGNRAYDPAVLALQAPLFAHVEQGRITGFDGPEDQVAKVTAHYTALAEAFGLDPFVVHSWHAGLHPGCPFFDAMDDSRDYWSNTVFSNPRLLHFHTCGTEPPGEISWNLVDATVRVDGAPLWDAGVLKPRGFGALSACLDAYPVLRDLFPG
ncbi:hypothetical protein VK792_10700 [Mesobacterium sp. TK19101]|uniref:Uncharacterized protein n=1 Tax=Mesobacterium hydrothermale TaxID=3111907 RepID=A0ABU6HIL8_9RHOB|nr:hypothetical protein [Mesobacterium sp. TK19101]MEC3861756.1 hypothetical protein [Mesobacterium sp. TK19101]